MMKNDKIRKLPDYSKSHVNRWADYIELRCLCGTDHFVSRDDVLDWFGDEDTGELLKGGSGHSAKYDELAAVIDNFYRIMSYRVKQQDHFYPFKREDAGSIALKDSLGNQEMHYIFLLACSCISFMDLASMQKITHLFEKYCKPIMTVLMPADARTDLFGTSKEEDSPFRGNLRARIGQLAGRLGGQTTRSMEADERYDKINAGDGGLDIISCLKLDNASHIPVAFGQCTCSYNEWINKQNSIRYDTWSRRIDPLAPFLTYMFVPFYCRKADGRFEQPADISTCLIDRQRILTILGLHKELFGELEELDIRSALKEIM